MFRASVTLYPPMHCEMIQVAMEVGWVSADWSAQQDGVLLTLNLLQERVQWLEVRGHNPAGFLPGICQLLSTAAVGPRT